MKKIATIAVLVLAAGCGNNKTHQFTPHLNFDATLMEPLVAPEANPSVNITVDGTCTGNSEAGQAEEAKHESQDVAAGATVSFELCQGDFTVTCKASDGWQVVCPPSVTMGEMSDRSVSALLTHKVTVDTTSLEALIAALQDAINGGNPASIASALAALTAKIDTLGGNVGNLQADIDALQAQALRLLYPGSVHFTVRQNSGTAIANAVCTETNVSWAALPAGENQVRTCTTNASGECEVANLYLDRALRFRCEAATYMTEANINITLTSAQPIQAWEVRLSAAGGIGDLLWQNFTVASGASRNVTGSVYQTQADGTLKAVSAADGLTCTISQGPNNISVDVDCTLLQGLAVGCGQATASLGGKSVLSKVRVTGTGAPATCP